MHNTLRLLSIVGIAFYLVACGGSTESATPSTPTPPVVTPPPPTTLTATASFGGLLVNNMVYSASGGLSGTTNDKGEFQYYDKDIITFTLGNYQFSVDSAALIDAQTSVYSTFPDDVQSAINLMRVLMSLDSDKSTANNIEITDVSAIPENLDLAMQGADFLNQFSNSFQATMPSFIQAKLQTDCWLDQRCTLDELISIIDENEVTSTKIAEVGTQLDEMSVALMQSIVSFNSYVFLDPHHTPVDVIKQRQIEAVAAMELLTKYATQGVSKSAAARVAVLNIQNQGYLTDGLDVIAKNSLSALTSMQDYFTSIKKASEDATFQLHQTLVGFTGSEESVNRWFEKAEQTAIFVKEASALSLTVVGTVYAAGTLTSVAVAEAGWAATSAMVVEGVASLDGMISGASALIKTTKAGADLFLGQGSTLAGYLTDNMMVNTIHRTSEVVSIVGVLTPANLLNPKRWGNAFSNLLYVAGQTSSVLYGNAVEFGDLSIKIKEIPKTMVDSVLANHTVRSQMINRVQTASQALVNVGRTFFNLADANLSEILDLILKQAGTMDQTVLDAVTEYKIATAETQGMNKNALLSGNYIDHTSLESVNVATLDEGIVSAILDVMPDEEIVTTIKEEADKSKFNEIGLSVDVVFADTTNLRPYRNVVNSPNHDCVNYDDGDGRDENGTGCHYRLEDLGFNRIVKKVQFYKEFNRIKEIIYQSDIGSSLDINKSYSVQQANYNAAGQLENDFYLERKNNDDIIIDLKNVFINENFEGGYVGKIQNWNFEGNPLYDIDRYENGHVDYKTWQWGGDVNSGQIRKREIFSVIVKSGIPIRPGNIEVTIILSDAISVYGRIYKRHIDARNDIFYLKMFV